MLFHFSWARIAPGGSLGVDVFFVLSGFLITTLLLQEWVKNGSIQISRFYARRALRLLPAMLSFVLFFGTVVTAGHFLHLDFTGDPPLHSLWRNLGLAAVYAYNWIGASGDYRVPGMGHLWSLAIEEQYYLVWPFLLAFLLRIKPSLALLLPVSLAGFVLSASTIFLWGDWNFDRLFFGTDFRIQALLAGSILGQLYVGGYLKPGAIPKSVCSTLTLCCGLTLLLLIAMLQNREPFMAIGGYTFVAVTSALLVCSILISPSAWSTRLLSQPWLTYIGKRSYSLYLWHYPFAFWLDSLPLAPKLVLAFALSFAAAELSYRVIESPALRLKSRFNPSSAAASRLRVAPEPERGAEAAA
jgi:peptidoglycan/LPS O-acetylase OafA/YrhL